MGEEYVNRMNSEVVSPCQENPHELSKIHQTVLNKRDLLSKVHKQMQDLIKFSVIRSKIGGKNVILDKEGIVENDD